MNLPVNNNQNVPLVWIIIGASILLALICALLFSCIVIYRYKGTLNNYRHAEKHNENTIDSDQNDIYYQVNGDIHDYDRINYDELNPNEMYGIRPTSIYDQILLSNDTDVVYMPMKSLNL